MPRHFAQLTFTDSVKAVQARHGTRSHAERYEASEIANEEKSSARTRANSLGPATVSTWQR